MRIILCTLLVLLSALSCEKLGSRDENCVPVKMVKELCGQAILEILDPAYYDHGQTWEDGDGFTHENVFKGLLSCNLSGKYEPGQKFFVQFGEASGDGCIQCKAYLYGPDKEYHVKAANCFEK